MYRKARRGSWKLAATNHPDSSIPAMNEALQHHGEIQDHRENGGTLGMVPLIINPIYTLCSEYLLGISPFKGLQQGGVFPQQGALHPKGHASNVRFANVTTWIPKSLECSVGFWRIPGGGNLRIPNWCFQT